ncbi:hypothetical protein ACFXKC_28575 [Streptomyces sp. NPDC059340]|uniref:hypothetical protein n=1 Tax=Streptomyces sp. NPDC059340 TaxID=3346806 RepID=UPI0036CA910F
MAEPSTSSSAATPEQAVRRLLITMADELAHNDPNRPLTSTGRGAMILRLTGRGPLYDLLLKRAPRITTPVRRAAYSARLRQIAGVR